MDAYKGEDKDTLMYMIKTTLFHKPQDKFFRKSPAELWDELPTRKSLFYMNGLAIGNLPSQLWANLMGAIFTWWIMHEKGYNNFIIFVDDFRVLVRSEAEGVGTVAYNITPRQNISSTLQQGNKGCRRSY